MSCSYLKLQRTNTCLTSLSFVSVCWLWLLACILCRSSEDERSEPMVVNFFGLLPHATDNYIRYKFRIFWLSDVVYSHGLFVVPCLREHMFLQCLDNTAFRIYPKCPRQAPHFAKRKIQQGHGSTDEGLRIKTLRSKDIIGTTTCHPLIPPPPPTSPHSKKNKQTFGLMAPPIDASALNKRSGNRDQPPSKKEERMKEGAAGSN